MKRISSFEVYNEENSYVIKYDKSHNIKKINIKLTQKYNGSIQIKYAQNGVTTDLIELAAATFKDEANKTVELDKPVSATHIYIMIDDLSCIEDIEVYAAENVSGDYYPKFYDKELDGVYDINEICVFTPSDGYSLYSIYASVDGVNFDYVLSKNNDEICDQITGDVYRFEHLEASVIRVYIEYNSNSNKGELSKVEITGKRISSKPSYGDIEIPDFQDSEYNVKITNVDTYNEVYGIIERQLGEKYKDWFILQLEETEEYDYFVLEDYEDKVKICGNNGVSLATGLNYYLKNYCNVHISQVGKQIHMPNCVIKIKGTVKKETKAKIRYAYNYCTFSYTMAFWGEQEWRNEIDWLALNGVNLVLDLTAQEEVWRRFLKKLGYTHKEIKQFISGPAYYGWAYMANLFGFGGPVHDLWFERRTALARRNHLIMRRLGIEPVLQGYSGMVPVDIEKKDPDIKIIPQGLWSSFVRPYMIETTTDHFDRYAKLFYQSQKEVYGAYSSYYATDPFHEGGKMAGMSPKTVAQRTLNAMLESDENAVWVIQSWQGNPTSELLSGVEAAGKEHALVLDLYADKKPNHIHGNPNNSSHGYDIEFNKTPWVFCMLNNFGGRLGLHGHLDSMARQIPKALNSCQCIKGVGITPEASENNPVLYEFLFDCIWQDDANESLPCIDMDKWICEYIKRRYGVFTDNFGKAWNILLETVYKAELNMIGQGAPECILNARPSLDITAASTWGNSVISYDKGMLERAGELLFADYDKATDSSGYRYDIITVFLQILSNRIQTVYNRIVSAFNEGDADLFISLKGQFLHMAEKMDKLASNMEYYSLGRWTEMADSLSAGTDDFTKKLYLFNAKSLITTWGSYNQSEIGRLHDYSNRQWSGLISDFYIPRWEKWFEERIKEMKGLPFEDKNDCFEEEWKWVISDKRYPVSANGNIKEILEGIINERL